MGVNRTETHVFSWLTRVKEARTELRPGSHGLKVEEPKHVRDGLSAIKESGREMTRRGDAGVQTVCVTQLFL